MSEKKITRRKFITVTSLGAAGVWVGLQPGLARAMNGGGGGGMGGGGGTTVIDPPPGLAFRDPVEAVKNAFGVYELEAKAAAVSLNGSTANLLTYNGSYPGPTIRARAGEELRIRLKNSLVDTGTNLLGHVRNLTNLHTHGLHVSPEPPADSMAVVLGHGGRYDYVYDMTFETPGHLNLYHPHVHGSAAEQYWGGLMGALVVDDEPDGPLAGYETHVMVLKDISLSGSAPAPHSMMSDYMQGKEGNIIMVNGQVNPLLVSRPGQVQRWQIVNGCNARFFKLSLEGHSLHLVGTDGGLLDRPYPVASILLSPGERIDVLVKAASAKKNYRLLSLAYDRGGMGALQQVTLLTLGVVGRAAAGSLPSLIDPGAVRLAANPAALPRQRLVLSMGQGRGYINGQTYVDMTNACTIASDTVGTWENPVYEVWEVVNQSGMDHPFHQHVNSAQVLAISGGDPAYAAFYSSIPAWKDTVIIPKWGSATLLVPVLDWPGMTMFHCHIMEHEDIGMMGVWHIMGGMPM